MVSIMLMLMLDLCNRNHFYMLVRKKQSELAWNVLEFWPSPYNLRVNLSVNNDIV